MKDRDHQKEREREREEERASAEQEEMSHDKASRWEMRQPESEKEGKRHGGQHAAPLLTVSRPTGSATASSCFPSTVQGCDGPEPHCPPAEALTGPRLKSFLRLAPQSWLAHFSAATHSTWPHPSKSLVSHLSCAGLGHLAQLPSSETTPFSRSFLESR